MLHLTIPFITTPGDPRHLALGAAFGFAAVLELIAYRSCLVSCFILVVSWSLETALPSKQSRGLWGPLDAFVEEQQAQDSTQVRELHHGGYIYSEPGSIASQLLQAIWQEFLVNKAAYHVIPLLNRIFSTELPDKYNLRVSEFHLGTKAPLLERLSAQTAPDGSLCAIDARFSFSSKDVEVVLTGKAPVGPAHVKVYRLKANGYMRLIPVPSENTLMISFLQPPAFEFGVDVVVGRTRVPVAQLPIITSSIEKVLKQVIVEPRRKAAPLIPHGGGGGRTGECGTLCLSISAIRNVPVLVQHSNLEVRAVVQVGRTLKVSPPMTVCPINSSDMRLQDPWTPRFNMVGCQAVLVLKIVAAPRVAQPQDGSRRFNPYVIGQALLDVRYIPASGCTLYTGLGVRGCVLAKMASPAPYSDIQWTTDLPIEQLAKRGRSNRTAIPYHTELSNGLKRGYQPFLMDPLSIKPNRAFVAEVVKWRRRERTATNSASSPTRHDASPEPVASSNLDNDADEDVPERGAAGTTSVRAQKKGLASSRYRIPDDASKTAYIEIGLGTCQWQMKKPQLTATDVLRTPGSKCIFLTIRSAEGHLPAIGAMGRTFGWSHKRDVLLRIEYGDVIIKTPLVPEDNLDWGLTYVVQQRPGTIDEFFMTMRTGPHHKGLARNAAETLGVATIPFYRIKEGTPHTARVEIVMAPEKSILVDMSIRLVPGTVDDADINAAFMRECREAASSPDRRSELRTRPLLVIERGRNLVSPRNASNAGSPYVEVVRQSRVCSITPVLSNTAEPSWQHALFLDEKGVDDTVLLRVKWGRAVLGTSTLKLQSLSSEFQGWLPISPENDGEIYVRYFFNDKWHSTQGQTDVLNAVVDKAANAVSRIKRWQARTSVEAEVDPIIDSVDSESPMSAPF